MSKKEQENILKQINEGILLLNSNTEKLNYSIGNIDASTDAVNKAVIEISSGCESTTNNIEKRKLAEQSKISSGDILDIVVNLKEEVDKALDSITHLSEVNVDEFKLVAQTEENLNNLFNGVKILLSKIE